MPTSPQGFWQKESRQAAERQQRVGTSGTLIPLSPDPRAFTAAGLGPAGLRSREVPTLAPTAARAQLPAPIAQLCTLLPRFESCSSQPNSVLSCQGTCSKTCANSPTQPTLRRSRGAVGRCSSRLPVVHLYPSAGSPDGRRPTTPKRTGSGGSRPAVVRPTLAALAAGLLLSLVSDRPAAAPDPCPPGRQHCSLRSRRLA
jgi:hypothetical protein